MMSTGTAKAEYANAAQVYAEMGITEEQFIASRMKDDADGGGLQTITATGVEGAIQFARMVASERGVELSKVLTPACHAGINEALKAEFAADQVTYAAMEIDEENYVRSRRRDLGLESIPYAAPV